LENLGGEGWMNTEKNDRIIPASPTVNDLVRPPLLLLGTLCRLSRMPPWHAACFVSRPLSRRRLFARCWIDFVSGSCVVRHDHSPSLGSVRFWTVVP